MDNNAAIKWVDETSYRQGDKQRVPSVLRCNVTDNIIFKVHRHIHYGDEWLLSSVFLGIDKYELKTDDLSVAKCKAIGIVIKHLSKQAEEIKEAINILNKLTNE